MRIKQIYIVYVTHSDLYKKDIDIALCCFYDENDAIKYVKEFNQRDEEAQTDYQFKLDEISLWDEYIYSEIYNPNDLNEISDDEYIKKIAEKFKVTPTYINKCLNENYYFPQRAYYKPIDVYFPSDFKV